jgi:hypothetical protein
MLFIAAVFVGSALIVRSFLISINNFMRVAKKTRPKQGRVFVFF